MSARAVADLGADMAGSLAALASWAGAAPDVAGRLARLEAFASEHFGMARVALRPVGRASAEAASRPSKGEAAFLEQVAGWAAPLILAGEEARALALGGHRALPELVAHPSHQTVAMIPLATPGRLVGAVFLADEKPSALGPADLPAMAAFGAQAAALVDAWLLAEELRQKEAHARALGDLDMAVATTDLVAIVRQGVRAVAETVKTERVLIYLRDPATGSAHLAVAEGCTDPELAAGGEAPCARLAMGALDEGRTCMGQSNEGGCGGCALRPGVATPIEANRQAYGALVVMGQEGQDRLARPEITFINQVALKLALVIHNAQAYMTIYELNEQLERRVKERTLALEQAIQRLQETQAQLIQSEKLATIGTLAGGVAHELNNPLSAILANVQLLKLDLEEVEDHADSLSLIEAGAKRCKAIVENLLGYARRSGPELRSLSVNAVLGDTMAMLNHQLKHANVELVQELGTELPPVRGIANELSQVFTNLIVNALDAVTEQHPQGGGRLRLNSAVEKGHIVVSFEDNGPGLDARMQRKIFDPFFTTKEVGKGTGLGLAVSQQIAGSFGGRVEVRSEKGLGATFRVILPFASPEPGEHP